jgi:hypothetical protein
MLPQVDVAPSGGSDLFGRPSQEKPPLGQQTRILKLIVMVVNVIPRVRAVSISNQDFGSARLSEF